MSTEYPQHFPAQVNPWRMAENQQTLAGSIPISQMSRLDELLYRDQGQVAPKSDVLFTADFGVSMDKRSTIQLRVKAQLPLQCQRSMQSYLQVIEHEVELTLVDTRHQDNADDGTDVALVESSLLAIAEVVEDELILALPLIAVNPDCPVVDYHSQDEDYTEPEKPNPFAALQKPR